MNIYVGNLSYQMEENELQNLFERFGSVDSARIITDRDTGRSKGFGFVEMPVMEQAKKAIADLDGSEVSGRRVVVNEARPRGRR